MVSIGALQLGPSGPIVSSSKSLHRNLFASCRLRSAHSRAFGRNAKSGLRVQAIAAPEKPSSVGAKEPFTAWGTAIERVAKRTDLKTIMILGAGPIVIGQVRQTCQEHLATRCLLFGNCPTRVFLP